MRISKDSVHNTNELLTYIRNYTKRRVQKVYHYTSYESLVMILKNKSFRLTRHDLLNDKAEKTLARCNANETRYIMSFSNSEKEYVSMWAMYGKASGIKLRLDFPTDIFKNCINNNFFFDAEKTEKISSAKIIPSQINFKKDFFLHDMVYFDRTENKIKHNARPFTSVNIDEDIINSLAGYIKYDAWEFEKETRLSVLLEVAESNRSENIVKNIYAGINDELIKSISITYNPWISEALKIELQKSLDDLAGFYLSHNLSANNGEIAEL